MTRLEQIKLNHSRKGHTQARFFTGNSLTLSTNPTEKGYL